MSHLNCRGIIIAVCVIIVLHGRPGQAEEATRAPSGTQEVVDKFADIATWKYDAESPKRVVGVALKRSRHGTVAVELGVVVSAARPESLPCNTRELPADFSRELGRLTDLEVVDVSCSDFGDEDLQELKSLHKLKTLDLSDTKVTRRGLESLVWAMDLESLRVARTRVSSGAFRRLPKLRLLDVTGTPLTEFSELPIAERTRELLLGCTKVDDDQLKSILKLCPHLDGIDLRSTGVTDRSVELLGEHAFKRLLIKGTKLSTEGIQRLSSMSSARTNDFDEALRNAQAREQLFERLKKRAQAIEKPE